ncbi:DegV family protein [Anaerotignum sp.]|uniref:DegV family protein n=1 Tax=Anaerotignum sp. TaxID=2039241 RepID=UPI0033327886
MRYAIIADSGCDLTELNGIQNVLFQRVPLTLRVGEREYVDDTSLDIKLYMDDVKNCTSHTRSAAPSPAAWIDAFQQADEIIAITITSTLSGSNNSAQVAKETILSKDPTKKIHIIDSLSAGPEITLLVYKLAELMEKELSFSEIVDQITQYQEKTHLLFILESLENLIRNGRVNKHIGKLVGMLGIRILGRASVEGELEVLHKCRGRKKAYEALLNTMIETGYNGGKVIISHCFNEAGANHLKKELEEKFPACAIQIMPTGGLCSYYAEMDGIMLAFEANVSLN